MTKLTKILTLTCLLLGLFLSFLHAEDIIKLENDKFVVTLDAGFWEKSESIKTAPEIVINATPIKPGNIICYYQGLTGEQYTYVYQEIKNKYIIINKYNGIETDFNALNPFTKSGRTISIEVENAYKKVFHLFIKGVTIKMSHIKKTDDIMAEPITKKSKVDFFGNIKDFLGF